MGLYFLMALLFVALAVLQALDASLVGLGILPWFNGMRWLRVHFITLGALTEVLFGVLPWLVAQKNNLPRPQFRWDIWLALNSGILSLLVGIPLVNAVPIYAGGTLVFVATVLLMGQLWGLRGGGEGTAVSPARKFYLVGLAYFLLGIIIGTGLWFNWPNWLHIAIPLETHIHANNWGFMSLTFAGLMVDLYPRWTKRQLAMPHSITPIFWMMTLGALGLVLGPWFDSLVFTVPGLVLHLGSTFWLLYNVIKPLRGDRAAWTPGVWHLISAYVWILVPVLVAPFLILGIGNLPGPAIESNAPQALIYGWLLQVGYAILPYFFRRILEPQAEATLGGNWLSLATSHLGGLFLWLSIFIVSVRGVLQGIAYGFWVVSLIPIAIELGRIVNAHLAVDNEQLAMNN
ncbi:MAG: hypothetical protein H6662_19280 [Ardenticatenaceae bacterium]|nr:hypothetical protein [Anaerolineales bacterium]MCB8923729.1 hypothetical protein [Ardenticatenaceae bacterium]MCB9005701.1 hypothetical protein [Ardenticatenaceae bacterium]